MEGLIFGSLMLVLLLAVAWLIASIWEEYQKESRQSRRKQELLQDVVAAVTHSQPTWEQILDMAESAGMGARDTYNLIRQLLHRILTGKAQELYRTA
jgi:hypothetical protein